jgi:hypothetical protein
MAEWASKVHLLVVVRNKDVFTARLVMQISEITTPSTAYVYANCPPGSPEKILHLFQKGRWPLNVLLSKNSTSTPLHCRLLDMFAITYKPLEVLPTFVCKYSCPHHPKITALCFPCLHISEHFVRLDFKMRFAWLLKQVGRAAGTRQSSLKKGSLSH